MNARKEMGERGRYGRWGKLWEEVVVVVEEEEEEEEVGFKAVEERIEKGLGDRV